MVAHEMFGPKSEAGKRGSAERCVEIDRGDTAPLITAVGILALAMGLCVGSGVVEAGCKTAIGVRTKRAGGLHWTLLGLGCSAAASGEPIRSSAAQLSATELAAIRKWLRPASPPRARPSAMLSTTQSAARCS